jgi:nicotinate-nucleotide pyrophosphorylase (carboxylating)
VVVSVAAAELRAEDVQRVVAVALAEDVASGDVTTDMIVAEDARAEAALLVKEPGVVCGLPVAEEIFRALDPSVAFDPLADDGDVLDQPCTVARLAGTARAILTGERTALNVLGRLSGVATLTRRFVDTIEGTRAQILDTRKTTPGLRALEKYAVRCGGGRNHRFGLDDAVLIKDNHLAVAGSISAAVAAARATGLSVQVEAETLEDVREALVARADAILLDNMSNEQLAAAAALVDGRTTLEASGGVSLETARAIAETGVDFISVGALTHSARSLDVSLEVQ